MRVFIVLHILRKDLRRHWIEISLFALMCLAWAWQTAHPLAWRWMSERELVPIVLFALWGLVTVRVIQGECLVGDREFWSTRPYRWNELMMAKLLMLALCLNGPLLIAELYLFHIADIPFLWSFIPGLLFLQCEFFLFITFPVATLASMTESIVQWLLTVGIIVVYSIFISWLPWGRLPSTLSNEETVASLLGGAVILPALIFAFVWQYARRRVWLARAAIVLAMLAVPATVLIASTRMVRGIAYPHSAGESPLVVTAMDNGGSRIYLRYNTLDNAGIVIPVIGSVNDSSLVVQTDGMRIHLSGDNGWQWTSAWLNQSLRQTIGSSAGEIRFELPIDTANKLQQLHTRASVDLALEVYRLGPMQKVATNADTFSLPGVGTCSFHHDVAGFFSSTGLNCVAPLRLPGVVYTQVLSSEETCRAEAGQSPLPSGHYAAEVQFGSGEVPADFDPNPVRTLNFNMGIWHPRIPSSDNQQQFETAAVCRGTPVLLQTGSFVHTLQTTTDLGPIGAEKRIPAPAGDEE